MRFDLRAPCDDCPFLRKGGIRLTRERVTEIASGCLGQGAGAIFPCHKYAYGRRAGWQHCAGAIVFAQNNGIETQGMQLAERFGWLHPETMRGHARVFRTLAAMLRTAIDRSSTTRRQRIED